MNLGKLLNCHNGNKNPILLNIENKYVHASMLSTRIIFKDIKKENFFNSIDKKFLKNIERQKKKLIDIDIKYIYPQNIDDKIFYTKEMFRLKSKQFKRMNNNNYFDSNDAKNFYIQLLKKKIYSYNFCHFFKKSSYISALRI